MNISIISDHHQYMICYTNKINHLICLLHTLFWRTKDIFSKQRCPWAKKKQHKKRLEFFFSFFLTYITSALTSLWCKVHGYIYAIEKSHPFIFLQLRISKFPELFPFEYVSVLWSHQSGLAIVGWHTSVRCVQGSISSRQWMEIFYSQSSTKPLKK